MERQIIYYDESCLDYIKHLSQKNSIVLIYSPTTIEKCKLQELLDLKNVKAVSSHVTFTGLLKNYSESFDISIGLGGGAAIDRAKYLAYNQNIPCVAIPSILSTNVFSTNKVAYIDDNNNKETIDSVLPEIVIYDNSLIPEIADKYSIYGLTDAISILTALKDWEIADLNKEEKIDSDFYIRAVRILNKAKRLIWRVKCFRSIDIFNLLCESGYITNDYGNGRPESGSEHILAKIIENKIEVPHAVAVAFSMLIVSQFHHCFDEVADLLANLGDILFDATELPFDIMYNSIKELKPRSDRYSVINILNQEDLSNENIQLMIDRAIDRSR